MHNTQETQDLTHLAGIAGLFVKYVARRDWEAASAARTDMLVLINDQQAATVARITEAAHRGSAGRTVTDDVGQGVDWPQRYEATDLRSRNWLPDDLRTQIDRAQDDVEAQLGNAS